MTFCIVSVNVEAIWVNCIFLLEIFLLSFFCYTDSILDVSLLDFLLFFYSNSLVFVVVAKLRPEENAFLEKLFSCSVQYTDQIWGKGKE